MLAEPVSILQNTTVEEPVFLNINKTNNSSNNNNNRNVSNQTDEFDSLLTVPGFLGNLNISRTKSTAYNRIHEKNFFKFSKLFICLNYRGWNWSSELPDACYLWRSGGRGFVYHLCENLNSFFNLP